MAAKPLTDYVESVSNPQTREQGLKDLLCFLDSDDGYSTEEIVDSLILPSLTEIIVPSQTGENDEILSDAVKALHMIINDAFRLREHVLERMNDMLSEELIGNLLHLWRSEYHLLCEVLGVLLVICAFSEELRARIKRCGIVSAALKIRSRLHGAEVEGVVAHILLDVDYGKSVPEVLEFAILTITECLLADERVCPTPEEFRELLPLLSRTLNKGYQGRDFLGACNILEHLVGKVETAADSVYASGLVPRMMRFLNLSNPPAVKVKVLQFLIKFALEGSKFCEVLLEHNVLEKLQRIVNYSNEPTTQTLSLQLLQAIVCKGSILAKIKFLESDLYRDLGVLYNQSSLVDRRIMLEISQCIPDTDVIERHISAEWRQMLYSETSPSSKF